MLVELSIETTAYNCYSCTFYKETIFMGPFVSQKTVNMIFFTDCCVRNFSFTGLLVRFSLNLLSFSLRYKEASLAHL